MYRWTTAMLALTCLMLVACGGQSPTDPISPTESTVTGVITDALDGMPLPHAFVSAYHCASFGFDFDRGFVCGREELLEVQESDAAGRYTLVVPRTKSSLSLKGSAAGFFHTTIEISVVNGGGPYEVNFALERVD